MTPRDLVRLLPANLQRSLRDVHTGLRQLGDLTGHILDEAPTTRPAKPLPKARPAKRPAKRKPDPEPPHRPDAQISAERLMSAVMLVSQHSGIPPVELVASPDARQNALKRLKLKLHPDNAATGNADLFRDAINAHEDLCRALQDLQQR